MHTYSTLGATLFILASPHTGMYFGRWEENREPGRDAHGHRENMQSQDHVTTTTTTVLVVVIIV